MLCTKPLLLEHRAVMCVYRCVCAQYSRQKQALTDRNHTARRTDEQTSDRLSTAGLSGNLLQIPGHLCQPSHQTVEALHKATPKCENTPQTAITFSQFSCDHNFCSYILHKYMHLWVHLRNVSLPFWLYSECIHVCDCEVDYGLHVAGSEVNLSVMGLGLTPKPQSLIWNIMSLIVAAIRHPKIRRTFIFCCQSVSTAVPLSWFFHLTFI